jgi:hypothetical protein
MNSLLKKSIFCLIILLSSIGDAIAAHPLITDDTGTQGKGKFQIEINGLIGIDKDIQVDESGTPVTVKSQENEIMTSITYGIIDPVDLILSFPYQWKNSEIDSSTILNEKGISDISIEVKWRFFEKEHFSIALKPGITLPTGDTDKYLGTGRMTCSVFFITSTEIDPLDFHLNLGYIRNENKLDQREDIWHASLASEWKVFKVLKVVTNMGVEQNTDKTSSVERAFILGGIIYSPIENLDIDVGIKTGITSSETDYMFLGGITFRF